MVNMAKGLIPLPTHTKRFVDKVNGVGMDIFAQKRPQYPGRSRVHRMQGTLWSTDAFFRMDSTAALTDVGIDHQTGECLIWVPFWDTHVVPWASGPVKEPYGDALCNLQHNPLPAIGVNLANWGGVSLELSGFFAQPGTNVVADSPWSDKSKHVLAEFIASLAHDAGITYDKFPYDSDGCSVVTFHEEWIGKPGTGNIPSTSKHCPGDVVMAAIGGVINTAQGIMKAAQTDGESPMPPKPKPGIAYPEGVDEVTARSAFGRWKDPKTGKVYAFDPNGPVSRLWLDLAVATSPQGQPMQLPEIDHVQFRSEGGKPNQKPYFFFSNGWIIYKKSAKAAYSVVGTGLLDDDLRKAASDA